jgi:homocysteine S-methyltransferase
MGNPLQSFLEQQGFIVLDGGLATELEKRGADLDHFLWSARLLAEAPELIRQVHQDYIAAGADIIATATYQASFDGFARAGFDRGKGEELMRLSVALAARARDRFWDLPKNRDGRLRPLIAASIGPYGASLHDGSEYHGNYDIDRMALRDFHAERLDVLADTQADLFAFETIPSKIEGEVLVELMADYPGKVAWLSFSCRDETCVSHGETFSDCAALADTSGQIVAVGINCTAPQHIAGLLGSASGLQTPLVVYPNSGEHCRLIGGCCRTGPEDIREIRAELSRIAG